MSAVRAIYGALRTLGIADEDDRRDVFEQIIGKRSLRAMSAQEQADLARALKSKTGGKAHARSALSGPYAKKLQALWIATWNLGLVTDKRDTALMAFVKRQCGIAHMGWLRDPADAEKVIEAIKKWMSREAGIVWTDNFGHRFLNDHAAKIAWAIWCKLHSDQTPDALGGFAEMVRAVLGRTVGLDALTTRDWQIVSAALGDALRCRK